MAMISLPVSPAYRESIKVAMLLQVFTTLVLLTLLDGGTLARAGGCAMIGFWIGVGIIIARRPMTPSTLDLRLIRWGYVALLLIGFACVPFMGVLRR